MHFHYPSRAFPSPVSVRVDLDDAWEPLPDPAFLVAGRRSYEDGLASSLTVQSTRYPSPFTVEDATAALNQAIDDVGESTEIARAQGVQSGFPVYVREFAYEPEPGRGILQNARIIVVEEGAFVSVVQVMVGVTSDDPVRIAEARAIADSVEVGPPVLISDDETSPSVPTDGD